MGRQPQWDDEFEETPVRAPAPRAPLPARDGVSLDNVGLDSKTGMTHEQLVAALRAVEGLVDVGQDPPNFHFRSRPFLHFHVHEDGMYADVRFGSGDFEPIWVSTPREREELLARVYEHIERLQGSRKGKRGRSENRE